VKAISNASDARDLCPEEQCPEPDGVTLMQDAGDAARISNIAFAVGAAALTAGLVLYLATPSQEAGDRAAVFPLLSPSSAGLAIRGRL